MRGPEYATDPWKLCTCKPVRTVHVYQTNIQTQRLSMMTLTESDSVISKQKRYKVNMFYKLVRHWYSGHCSLLRIYIVFTQTQVMHSRNTRDTSRKFLNSFRLQLPFPPIFTCYYNFKRNHKLLHIRTDQVSKNLLFYLPAYVASQKGKML